MTIMNIGFMQGRLCDRVGSKIQAFPWTEWDLEFPRAQLLKFRVMEWTLDLDRLYENPLLTRAGRYRIRKLSQTYGVNIPSLTADFFMEAPFFKADIAERIARLRDLQNVIQAAHEIGIRYIVIPLVDNGTLETLEHQAILIENLLPMGSSLTKMNMKILFESSFSPKNLEDLISCFPSETFGINYDIGNSAALDYDSLEELSRFGHRVDNVHVKDRLLRGVTTPLGTGNANFNSVFVVTCLAGIPRDSAITQRSLPCGVPNTFS